MKNSKKRLVYTVILGDYDILDDVINPSKDIDYICITDNRNLKSSTWKINYIGKANDPILTNRKYKFFPYKYFNHSESIYIDGNISVCGDLNLLFEKHLKKSDIAIPKHPFRNCIYDEAKTCIDIGKLSKQQVENQINKYITLGFPKNNGLFENNIIVRKHTPDIMILMEDWWMELNLHTKRDQLSLCYVLWKNRINCEVLKEGPRYTSKFFSFRLHKKELSLPLIKRMAAISALKQKKNFFYYMTNLFFKLIKKVLNNSY